MATPTYMTRCQLLASVERFMPDSYLDPLKRRAERRRRLLSISAAPGYCTVHSGGV